MCAVCGRQEGRGHRDPGFAGDLAGDGLLRRLHGELVPHLRAVRDGVEDGLREEHGLHALVSDGDLESQWLISHYGDVMVHVLQQEKREYYCLEDLWGEAKRVKWKRSTKEK